MNTDVDNISRSLSLSETAIQGYLGTAQQINSILGVLNADILRSGERFTGYLNDSVRTLESLNADFDYPALYDSLDHFEQLSASIAGREISFDGVRDGLGIAELLGVDIGYIYNSIADSIDLSGFYRLGSDLSFDLPSLSLDGLAQWAHSITLPDSLKEFGSRIADGAMGFYEELSGKDWDTFADYIDGIFDFDLREPVSGLFDAVGGFADSFADKLLPDFDNLTVDGIRDYIAGFGGNLNDVFGQLGGDLKEIVTESWSTLSDNFDLEGSARAAFDMFKDDLSARGGFIGAAADITEALIGEGSLQDKIGAIGGRILEEDPFGKISSALNIELPEGMDRILTDGIGELYQGFNSGDPLGAMAGYFSDNFSDKGGAVGAAAQVTGAVLGGESLSEKAIGGAGALLNSDLLSGKLGGLFGKKNVAASIPQDGAISSGFIEPGAQGEGDGPLFQPYPLDSLGMTDGSQLGIQSPVGIGAITEPGPAGSMSMEKFCDAIEIHIASADDKGYEQIAEEITEVIKMVIDNYGN